MNLNRLYFNKWHKAFRPHKLKQLPSRLLQFASLFFCNRSFYLQGQMDINKKSLWYSAELEQHTGGFMPINRPGSMRELVDLEPWDNVRRDMLILLLKKIEEDGIFGDYVELGVYKGGTAKLLHHYSPNRILHLFDTFKGFTKYGSSVELANTGSVIKSSQFNDTTIGEVLRYVSPQNNNVKIYQGLFPDSLTEQHSITKYAFVHIDADLYSPIYDALKFFYPRLTPGGVIVIHDYHAWLGAHAAVKEFSKANNVRFVPMPDKSGSAVIIKQ